MAVRKKAREPSLRVMLNVGHNRYEWRSPTGMTWDELELCGIQVFTDFNSGCCYVPLML